MEYNFLEYSKEQLSSLLPELIKDKKVLLIREIFDEYNIVDLSEIFSELELDEAIFVFKILPKDISAELFTYLDSEHQERLISALSSMEVKNILDNMFSDDIIDFLEEMPANVIKYILENVPADHRKEINTLLSYEENTAGSVMSTDFVELHEEDTVEEAIIKIKKQAEIAETINVCFVIDKKRVLVGVVNLRDIIIAKNDKLISEIMDKNIHYVYTNTDQEEVARLLSKYDLTTICVLNDQHCLIGIVTADDVLDILTEEATEDIHKMSGIIPTDGSYLKTGTKEMVKSRISWLLILMISATFTGYILQYFEDKLSAVAILSASIPIIMSTAGNAGAQSSTMVIRGIAVDDLSINDIFIVLRKELFVGLLCGAILFITNFIRLFIFGSKNTTFNISLVVSLTITISLVSANIAGGVLPLLAKKLKMDPASAAAPLITTIVDATSLIIYFMLAIAILKI